MGRLNVDVWMLLVCVLSVFASGLSDGLSATDDLNSDAIAVIWQIVFVFSDANVRYII